MDGHDEAVATDGHDGAIATGGHDGRCLFSFQLKQIQISKQIHICILVSLIIKFISINIFFKDTS
jgi:hypothetical protein